MKEVLSCVAAFHKACDHPVITDGAKFPSQDRIDLRNALIVEEHNEFKEAVATRDIEGVADALGDMIYILAGTALEYGIPLDRVFEAIQQSNMEKVDPKTRKVRKREDGKVLKPTGWQPPDIKSALCAHPNAIHVGAGFASCKDCGANLPEDLSVLHRPL